METLSCLEFETLRAQPYWPVSSYGLAHDVDVPVLLLP